MKIKLFIIDITMKLSNKCLEYYIFIAYNLALYIKPLISVYNKMLKNLLILGFAILVVHAGMYKKHVYDTSSGARCLDGSPAYVLMHEGAEKEKILLYFLGGGFCEGSTEQ